MKRLILATIVACMITGNFAVFADPDNTEDVRMNGLDSKVQNILVNIAEMKQYMSSASQTSEYKLFELAMLANISKQLYYLAGIDALPDNPQFSNNPSAVSGATLKELTNEVVVLSNAFATKYGLSDDIVLKQPDWNNPQAARESIRTQLAEILGKKIPDILFETMKPVLEEASNSNGDNTGVVTKHGEALYWTGEILDTLTSFDEDFKDVKEQNASLGEAIWLSLKKLLSIPTQNISEVLSQDPLWSPLKDLVASAKTTRVGTSRNTGYASLDGEIQYQIEALATVKRKDDAHELDYSIFAWEPADGISKITLKSPYISMLAATAVYTPFKSHVGDADYMAALKSLAAADQEDRIVSLFNSIKDKRKPLYFMTAETIGDLLGNLWGTSYDHLKGVSYRATLGDLIRFAENGDDTVFFTARGEFKTGVDMNSWAFYQAPTLTESGTGVVKSSTADGEYTVIPAEKNLSGDTYTRTLFEMGNSPGNLSAGLLLFNNAYYDLRNTNALEQRKTDLLYMNIFGDVVLSDNTVIISGASNPILYNPNAAYNPYTVAFMNSYPRLAQDSTSLRVQSANDFNKFLLFADRNILQKIGSLFSYSFSDNNIKYTKDAMKTGVQTTNSDMGADAFFFDHSSLEIRKIQSEDDFAPAKRRRAISIFPFFYGGGESGTNDGNYYSFLRLAHTDNVSGYHLFGAIRRFTSDALAITFEQTLTGESYTLFPYSPDENFRDPDNTYYTPQLIAQNMYWYYMCSNDLSMGTTLNSNLRADYIYENLVVEFLQGTEYVASYEKNLDLSDYLTNAKGEEWEQVVRNLAQALLDNVGEMDGVLGMTPADANPVFGKILIIARKYAMFIFFFFIVIFIFRYMKRGDLLHVGTMITVYGVFLYFFIFILPTYVPIMYNAVGRMFTEGLVANTVLYKAEKYSTTYGEAKKLNVEDNYDVQTLSVTLYRMSEEQLVRFAQEYGGDAWEGLYESFRYGKRVILDSDLGLFIQGDCLKVNVDVMLLNNPITGRYIKGSEHWYYELVAEKKTSSVLDFYFPFYTIEDGFVETLNALLRTYSVPRSTANYYGGLIKDNYIVFNYTNSIPFLYPDDFLAVEGLSPIELFKLEDAFPNAADFLNLSDWIHNPKEEFGGTLWFRSMVANGFYDPVLGYERRSKLIEYVNYHTKRFLIENASIIGTVSDENMIKVTTMHASFYFNSYISQVGTWVHPWNYNQEELKLNDVFLTALTTNSDRFIRHNFDVVTFISNNHGGWGVICLIFILCFGMLFVVLIKFSMPLLYFLLGVTVIFNLLLNKPIILAFKGYLKSTLAVVGIYTTFIVVLTVVPQLIGGMAMLISLVAINVTLFYIALSILIGFLRNISAIGNQGVSAALRNNFISGLVMKPVSNVINNVQERMMTTTVMPSLPEEGVALEEYNQEKANRRYIINAMDDDIRRSTRGSVREPRVTYSRSVLHTNNALDRENSHIVVDSGEDNS